MSDQPDPPAPTAERIEFNDMPPHAVRETWAEWLRQHGVDPSDVVIPGWIERHPSTYRIVYASGARDENGRFRWDRESRTVVPETHVFQMEAPPLPFPDVEVGW